MNEMTMYEPQDDGWADAAQDGSDKIIQGHILKFSDGAWMYGQNSTPVPDKLQLIAHLVRAAWVRWEGGKPVEYKMRANGAPWDDRHILGYDDEAGWEVGPDGRARDPWQQTKFMYLTQPGTAEAYTYTCSSWSGRSAVDDLGGQIVRKRFSGRKVLPLIELHSAPMKTKFGMKRKPVLKVVDWVLLDGSQEPDPAPIQTVQPERIKGLISQATKRINDMDDEVPF